ncbi:MAG: HlyD family efflux transporter periplasmic adaptor subunit [Planctomycetota bacterium]
MIKNLIIIGLVVSLLAPSVSAQASSTSLSQSSSDPSIREVIKADNCEIETINSVEVAAKVDGILNELMFEEGDEVNEGDVMAKQDDVAASMMVDLKMAEEKEARITAANEVQLKDAVASADVAEAEYKSFQKLYEDNAIPYWEMEKKRLEASRQRLRIDLAKMEQKVNQVRAVAKRSELEMAQHERSKHQIVAPVTGIIEQRIAQKGQWMQAGTPVAQVLQMDKLRVTGDINAMAQPGIVRKGAAALVTIRLGDRELQMEGEIGYVSLSVDLRDRNKVWVVVENQRVNGDWLLKPGMTASIEIIP